MFFTFDQTISAGTLEAASVRQRLRLPPGIVRQVDVVFPTGCVGLVHCRIWRGANQVWPTNPGGSFNGNGPTITWAEDYRLEAAPFEFSLEAWNEDDTFEHTITVRFAMLAFPRETLEAMVLRLAEAAGEVIEV